MKGPSEKLAAKTRRAFSMASVGLGALALVIHVALMRSQWEYLSEGGMITNALVILLVTYLACGIPGLICGLIGLFREKPFPYAACVGLGLNGFLLGFLATQMG